MASLCIVNWEILNSEKSIGQSLGEDRTSASAAEGTTVTDFFAYQLQDAAVLICGLSETS